MNKFNVRAEYDLAPIRHIAVQCPYCHSWYCGYDISNDNLMYHYQIELATFHCPNCDKDFGYGTESDMAEVVEMDYPEIYNDVFEKRVVWEKKG